MSVSLGRRVVPSWKEPLADLVQRLPVMHRPESLPNLSALDVIVRCKNEMPFAARTFEALAEAGVRTLVLDNGSTDGSVEAAVRVGAHVVHIPKEEYVPGRVLNLGMRLTESPVVAFVNADAVPLEPMSLVRLAAPCVSGVAACFGRQVPREGADAATLLDHARCFPPANEQPQVTPFFSLAASALRRDVWQQLPFSEELRYSEDVDWVRRARALGLDVAYAPDALFEHSHDYGLSALYRRMRGEGEASTRMQGAAAPSLWRGLVRPALGWLLRDARALVLTPQRAVRRIVAQVGRYQGARAGASWVASTPSASRVVPMSHRYTVRGDPLDEAHVEKIVEAVASHAKSTFGAATGTLVLAGSFGSEEGVVEVDEQGQRAAHNDLDFIFLVDGRRKARALRAPCQRFAEEESRAHGTRIDLFPLDTRELSARRGKLLWIDTALRGCRVVAGDPRRVEPLKGLSVRSLFPEEIGRLLVNRATGIALSRLRFALGYDEQRTAARHLAKAQLAVGDALLLLENRYARTAADRAAALFELSRTGSEMVELVAKGYEAALAYRQAPRFRSLSAAALDDSCRHLFPAVSHIEAARIGDPVYESAEQYAKAPKPRMPGLPDVGLGGRLFSGPLAALRGVQPFTWALEHPRELLARSAMLVAFTERDPAQVLDEVFGIGTGGAQQSLACLLALREEGA